MDVKVGLWRKLSTEELMLITLDCKEIQPVPAKGDQSWVFFGRIDAKAETPILWPPHAKSWFIGKDSDAGRDWGQEEKGTTEDEMAGWHHELDGHEFGWTPGVGDGQGGLACCSSWGRKEWDTLSNWTELIPSIILSSTSLFFNHSSLATLVSLLFPKHPATLSPQGLWTGYSLQKSLSPDSSWFIPSSQSSRGSSLLFSLKIIRMPDKTTAMQVCSARDMMIQKPGTQFSLFFISLSKYDYCILSKSKTLLEIIKSSVKRLVTK